jgi:predicted XRE-type DNA-binding protein
MDTKITESCGDIFQDLRFSPEESEKLNIKYNLMTAIETYYFIPFVIVIVLRH